MIIPDTRVVSIAFGCLQGQRPRPAGKNARLDEHGRTVRVPLLQLTTEDGVQGFGVCFTDQEQAARLLGMRLSDVFLSDLGVADAWQRFDYPLWDLVGQYSNLPVYALAAEIAQRSVPQSPYRVPCYDTSLYFDDLHLSDHAQAAQLMAEEALEGYRRGQRAFKIKVGRGARHLPLEAGMQRDIAIIRAVQKAVGSNIPLLIDANNGYNLNLTKHVLAEVAGCAIYWVEEAFHEDDVLYRDLQSWLKAHQLPTLISDGEGQADPRLLDWSRAGLVDVVQYDIFSHGFTRWLRTGSLLDSWGGRSAPHHYGVHYGNYVSGHLAGAIDGFTFIEWDEVVTPGLDAFGYEIEDGKVTIPHAPGFGLTLDEEIFQRAVKANGFSCIL